MSTPVCQSTSGTNVKAKPLRLRLRFALNYPICKISDSGLQWREIFDTPCIFESFLHVVFFDEHFIGIMGLNAVV
jgi:hypothetical protein